jgi:hypothetical protein
LAATLCLFAAGGTSAGAAEITARLRLAWGGGAARTWNGSIQVSEGQFSDLTLLGVEADEPGSIWIADGQIEIATPSPRTFDGVDFLWTGNPEATLTIRLVEAGKTGEQTIELTIGEILTQAKSMAIDDQQNRLVVQRAPGDNLRVEVDAPSLVFSPGDSLHFTVQPDLSAAGSAGRLNLIAELVESSSSRVLLQDATEPVGDPFGPPPEPIPFTFTLPMSEGVYDVRLRLHGRRLGLKHSLAERSIQLVVVAPDAAPHAAAEEKLALVSEIDPANPGWSMRLAIGSSPLRKGSLGIGATHPWQHPLGSFVQLGPHGNEPNISWEAYPLTIHRPGVPHTLEVDYPTDVPQTVGISIVEPNAAGELVPVGLDSGFYVPDVAADIPPRIEKHRLTFWPRTRTPLVLLTNRRDGARAVYGQLRVYQHTTPLTKAFQDSPRGRLLAGYMDRPLFNENFGAAESLDPVSGRSLDDWHTFYQGASRTVEYLEHVGYNGLILSVLADGSTIYPSRLLTPTPRYDSGLYFATAQDPMRKDSLELLFRLFDRAELQLIPQLHFASPLPQLEAILRRGGDTAVGIEWIGADGKTWLEHHSAQRGLAPYYNVLHPRVQRAMLDVLEELVRRYGRHPSFSGIALALTADGYAQLPGSSWGFDDVTIAQFERDTGIRLTPGRVDREAPDRFNHRAAALAGEHHQAWLDWRAKTLEDFYQRMQAIVAAGKSEAKLYLAATDCLHSASIQQDLLPNLRRKASTDGVVMGLEAIGLRPKSLAQIPNLVWMRPQPLTAPKSLAGEAIDLQIKQTSALDEMSSHSPLPAAFFFHEPMRARLESFDAKSPYRNSFTWLLTHAVPAADRNRQRFVHSLATLEAQALVDGGLLLPLGQEAAMADFVQVYRRLPEAQFASAAEQSQPVAVRTHYDGRDTWCYLVNDSSWQVRWTAQLTGSEQISLQSLIPDYAVTAPQRSEEAVTWTLDLKPFELVGVKFSGAEIAIQKPQVTLDGDVRSRLELQIKDLGERVNALSQPQPYDVLSDPGFETFASPAATSSDAWQIQGEARSRADTHSAHEGRQSAVLSTQQRSVSLVSSPFVAPATGRLSVSVWLRVEDAEQPPRVRLELLEASEGELIRTAAFGRDTKQALGAEWGRYTLVVDDLPLGELGDLRLRLALDGPGEVWIDDLSLTHLEFGQKEQQELQLLIYSVYRKLEKAQYADCAQLLEGYWPRFLADHVPLTQQREAVAAAPPSPARRLRPSIPERTSGMFDRLKRWVPRF